jgi:hypothetical protein
MNESKRYIKKLADKVRTYTLDIEDEINDFLKEYEENGNFIWMSKHRASANRLSLELTNTLTELRRALYGKEIK